MNASDARIAAIYTAQPGGIVKSLTPNAGSPKLTTFDLIIQLEAGNVLGQSLANYTLNVTAVNENAVKAEAGLVPVGNPFKEEFNGPVGPDWKPSGSDFVRTGASEPTGILRFKIHIPVDLTGRFHYNLELVSAGFQVVDLAESDAFLLV
ncbi:DUF4352 domain-containing protein [Frankia sp. AiPs1]|uniref:hypothetical protein n=1 Tax=Frankia sp. AiPa1 TaxID=573492 RepID=UPI00202B466C|nr:hypothetical protein [Frankia sp. AiPa1]MCL9759568.1 hypothetical protein [Frankia sp. AiPa1]